MYDPQYANGDKPNQRNRAEVLADPSGAATLNGEEYEEDHERRRDNR